MVSTSRSGIHMMNDEGPEKVYNIDALDEEESQDDSESDCEDDEDID